MVINGKVLAGKIIGQLKKEFEKLPRLAVGAVLVDKNPASISFLKQKSAVAAKLGIGFKIYQFSPRIKTAELSDKIKKLNKSKNLDAFIVQLPLPRHIDTDAVIAVIYPRKDIDALSSKPLVLSPVVEAVRFVFKKYKINYKGKNILIVGRGRLVGRPIYEWLRKENKRVKVIDPVREKSLQAAEAVHLKWTAFSNGVDEKQKNSIKKYTRNADIIISGVGKGGLIKGEMIKRGAVLIDFGFERSEGRVKGDFGFESCVKKAKLITPVPGGMGPIMVAMLFKNLITLAQRVEK